MLDLKLETFLAAAEHKNFTKASQLLSLTQPAVSHHITQLESEIGKKLFYRGKGGLKLTAGRGNCPQVCSQAKGYVRKNDDRDT